MVVSDHFLKKYSCNPNQTWWVHSLSECSELIHFWATLAKLWPSSVHKMTEYGGFWPLSKKIFMQSKFKLGVYTYWMSIQNWLALGPCWPTFCPLVATKWLKMMVSDHYLKKYSRNPIQTWCVHLLGECSEMVNFGPCWPDFGTLVATKWLKYVVSDCYLKKYSRNTIQTWYLYLLCECSQLICFWAMLVEFLPSIGKKLTKLGENFNF